MNNPESVARAICHYTLSANADGLMSMQEKSIRKAYSSKPEKEKQKDKIYFEKIVMKKFKNVREDICDKKTYVVKGKNNTRSYGFGESTSTPSNKGVRLTKVGKDRFYEFAVHLIKSEGEWVFDR